ncbi:hypothetical protein SERLA73DRAFT_190689 [Serpula lacrymans var. lacrymans S7.3]|uniref:Uncharacterized protein n=2 Tax=Serpula lacrymans var. lacrymans TaxID=341189 RepID=F8QG65_SERL3|nr:uncharacterized protein SERLADRAFT_478878 [Serpula lacrymans var. lacrymans S7.9]EGN92680.1 hypothetical protein SERLA73DRAFT_190689 [Serpula lacrymans var. lacrymans S7.3]EGO19455.1 hypothetical protein SERLADRAFT_478878 [Serpula lacrymans var. lacrymans S7.9]
MSKGKGKQVEPPSLMAPLPNPSAGSANPSASLSSLWGYIQPALDHIVRIPSTNPDKAPAVDIAYHMGIHTATYNYFTSQSEAASALPPSPDKAPASGTDLYEQIDKYFAEVARELLLGAPVDDSSLIHYLVPCYKRYSAGAQSVNRLLNYVNRHYVKRAIDEDRGWLTMTDIFDAIAKSIEEGDTREKISKKLKERRTEELKKWGYQDEDAAELLANAEACAEAASSLDRVVPLSSVALRRFRTELVEPLLAVPKMKGKGKKRPPKASSDKHVGPKGRLARAVKELLENPTDNEPERNALATGLAVALRSTGVRADHPLRKKLDKFVESLPS